MHELCARLGVESIGGNTYNEIRRIAEDNNIKLSFTFHIKPYEKPHKRKIEEMLVYGSRIKSQSLKNKLFRSGLKEERCERCGRTDWEGGKIPLELHHINGDRKDNRIENLQILCRNCHGQTDNFCGKNTNKIRRILSNEYGAQNEEIHVSEHHFKELAAVYSRKEIAEQLGVSRSSVDWLFKKCNIKVTEEWKDSMVKDDDNKVARCPECGRLFIKNTNEQIYCGNMCAHKASAKTQPNKEQLSEALLRCKNFLQVSHYYGVSFTAIKKWCKKYGLPCHKQELVEYKKAHENPSVVELVDTSALRADGQ